MKEPHRSFPSLVARDVRYYCYCYFLRYTAFNLFPSAHVYGAPRGVPGALLFQHIQFASVLCASAATLEGARGRGEERGVIPPKETLALGHVHRCWRDRSLGTAGVIPR